MEPRNRLHKVRLILVLTCVLLVLASYQLSRLAGELGVLFVSRRWTGILVFLLVGAVIALGLLVISWTNFWFRIVQTFDSGIQK